MDTPRPADRLWSRTLAVGLAAALLLSLLAVATMAAGLRADAARTADDLRAEGLRIAAAVDGAPAAAIRDELARAGVAARVVGPRGAILADGPLVGLWGAGRAPVAARATVWRSGATVAAGAVEEVVPLADGRTLIVRAPLAMGAGGLLALSPLLAGAIGVLSLLIALAWWRSARRRVARIDARAHALDAIAAGRATPATPGSPGPETALLDAAIARTAQRTAELQGSAVARVEALGAALAPLPLPAAARTPSGGLVRNEALERLVRRASIRDADLVEDALRRGLSGSGAVARRLDLEDGRALDAEAWAVPGGRVVVLAERSEQARLRALRGEIATAAARSMRGPLPEIRTRARELAGRLGGADAQAARAIVEASDRLERVTARVLRAEGGEGADRSAQLRPVGLASLAFGLGRAYDRRLRERGLRLEHDIPDDLPRLRADPGLLHEVLGELIDNAAAATPRGGVLTLGARALAAGGVEIVVADTGSGIPGRERDLVLQPFGRGAAGRTRPGAGLGLGVARALVERMGGSLSLGEGEGANVRLRMPSVPERQDAPVDTAGSPAGRRTRELTPAGASSAS